MTKGKQNGQVEAEKSAAATVDVQEKQEEIQEEFKRMKEIITQLSTTVKKLEEEKLEMREEFERKIRTMTVQPDRIYQMAPAGIYSPTEISALRRRDSHDIDTPHEGGSDRSTGRRDDNNAFDRAKLPTYDGKVEWEPYFLQFSHIADRHAWSDRLRLDKFIESLRDKALKFFGSRTVAVRSNFSTLAHHMEKRFGDRDPPHMIRRQLQELKQDSDESLEEYAERAQEMAARGFTAFPEDLIQVMATDGFLRGLLDKRAALAAMDKNPDSLEIAVSFVKSAMTNQQLVLGNKRLDAKRVHLPDEICEVRSAEYSLPPDLDKRMHQTEKEVQDIQRKVDKILDMVSSGRNMVSRSPSPARRQYSTKDAVCYRCGKEGHYARECPEREKITEEVDK